jgi:predicted glycoside hydrolase/deacetylase ChbG (UPF0249 family)
MGSNGERARVRLIVNADDFGLSETINAGVARACREGIVTSASLMAGGPAFGGALTLVDKLPELGVGVHLTLAAGKAVCPPAAAPTLVAADGYLPGGIGAFAGRFFSGAIDLADVAAELEAQVGRVVDAGVRVTHVDSHRHVHNFPGVAGVVVAVARRFGVGAVRFCRCRIWPRGRGWLGRQVALRLWAEGFGVRARDAGLKMPDGLEGQEYAGSLDAATLRALIGRLGAGTWELLCHPAEEAPGGKFDRGGDLAALTAAAVRAEIEERGVKLINFAAL